MHVSFPSRGRPPRLLRSVVYSALSVLLLSCAGDAPTGPTPERPDAGAPAQVQAQAGATQSGTAGTVAPAPLAVRVTDAAGKGVAGVSVAWAVASGGGSVSAAATPTDSAGSASVVWTLGPAAGTQSATGTVSGLPPVTFTAAASAAAPSRMEAVRGTDQTAPAGSPVPDSLAVRVVDAHGNPVAGSAVAWVVTTGGGSASPAGGSTDAAGVAKARWTLGAAGAQALEARGAGLSGSPVAFRATATTLGASSLRVTGGDGQTGTAGTALPQPLVVRLTDAGGVPVAGAAVTWMVTSGGGAVAPAVSTTDAEGYARGGWTLGTTMGAQGVRAAAAGLTADLTATATAGAAARVERVSGDGQTGTVGSALPGALVVRVTDAQGNPVSGAPVSWSVTAGGGSVPAPTSTSDAAGLARTAWTLGTAAGANALSASVSGAAPVAFAATGVPADAGSLVVAAGDGQSGRVGAALATEPAVRVTDASGNPVAGVSVAWGVTAGGGSVSAAATTTDAGGVARAGWTLGTAAGANTLRASSGSLAATFGATGVAGPAAALALAGGDGQSAPAGGALADSAAVRVTDAFGNPVQGATVGWTASSGGAPSPASSATGASGVARTRWTLGGTSGAQTLEARADGLSGSPVVLRATATVTGAPALARVSGDAQTAVVGTALSAPLVVRLSDAQGGAVAGATVTWTVSAGGGTLSAGTSVTAASGEASTTLTLGTAGGSRAVTATSGGAATTFTASGTAGPAARMAHVQGDAQTGPAGAVLATPLVVLVTDVYGNAVAGAPVAWTVAAGGGAVAPASAATGADGRAQASWTLGAAAGANRLTVASGAISLTLTATGTTPPGRTLQKVSGDGQTTSPGRALPSPFVVRLVDGSGAPVAAAEVGWGLDGTGSGSISFNRYTDANGLATATVSETGYLPGPIRIVARYGADSVSFSATLVPAEGKLVKVSGDGQTATAGGGMPAPFVVRLVDASGRPVAGAEVNWGVSPSGSTGYYRYTNAAGESSGTVSNAGTTAGPVRVVAKLGADSVSFDATVKAAAPSVVSSEGSGQAALPGSGLPSVLAVTVKDAYGNPVPGMAVTWSVASGGGSLQDAAASTSAAGRATARWTLGTAGTQSVAAGVAGFAPVSFTATITQNPVVSVTVTPEGTLPLAIGSSVQLTATMRDAGGNVLTGRPVTWSSSAPSIVSVDGSGRAAALGTGFATITATSEGVSGRAFIQAHDNQGPVLAAFSVSPNPAPANSAVRFTVGASDAGSQVQTVRVLFANPTGTRLRECEGPTLASGTRANGTWTCTYSVQPVEEIGTWQVTQIRLVSDAGKERVYPTADLQARGYPTSFTITNGSDTAPPTLTSFAVTPGSIPAATGGAFDFRIGASDGATGLVDVRVRMTKGFQLWDYPAVRESGTNAAGTWTIRIPVSAGLTGPGTATLAVYLLDSAGNGRLVTSSELQGMGFPGTVAFN